MSTPDTPFRLAFRNEGEFVNCYFTGMDSMEGAMLLGSMRRSVLTNTGLFPQWRELMQAVMSAACVAVLGEAPVGFTMEPGPEHERSGHG